MSLDELKLLLKYIKRKTHFSYLYIFILIITGSRFKPVRGLRYEHIDYENCTIFLNDTKNKYSQHKVKVPQSNLDHILQIIEDWVCINASDVVESCFRIGPSNVLDKMKLIW